MYKSPIDIIYGQTQTQIEGDIFKAIQSYAINVDKEELLRALRYDRDQYEKGYADGKREAMEGLVRCKDCDSFCPCENDSYICSRLGTWTDPDGWCYKGERREGE